MNLCRFADLLTYNTRWWICCSMDVVLHDKTLIDPKQQAMYLDIATNRKYNLIPFLDAAIVLRCLEKYFSADKYHHSTHQDCVDLMCHIKVDLDHEEAMSREPPMEVSKHVKDNMLVDMKFEHYEEPRMFTCDPHHMRMRMKS